MHMRVLWLSGFVVLIDQLTKAVVLETMYRGQSIPLVGDWLKFTFTENPGMAFGMRFGPDGTVTVLAILAMGLVAYYFFSVRHAYLPYRLSLAFIFGGAIGNIIDRVFYGVLLGYDGLFQGKVVDFIHVSVWKGWVPEWIPGYGGAFVDLFPIWNVADMAIVGGVIGVLIFHHTFHGRELKRLQQAAAPSIAAVEPPSIDFAAAPWRASAPSTLPAPPEGSTDPGDTGSPAPFILGSSSDVPSSASAGADPVSPEETRDKRTQGKQAGPRSGATDIEASGNAASGNAASPIGAEESGAEPVEEFHSSESASSPESSRSDAPPGSA